MRRGATSTYGGPYLGGRIFRLSGQSQAIGLIHQASWRRQLRRGDRQARRAPFQGADRRSNLSDASWGCDKPFHRLQVGDAGALPNEERLRSSILSSSTVYRERI